MQKIKKLIPLGLAFAPFIAFAVEDIQSLISVIGDILVNVVPLLIGIAVIVFLIGVIRYVTVGREEEEKRASARNMMIYGIIGIFVMVSVWGLVNILGGTFDLNPDVQDPDLIPAFRR